MEQKTSFELLIEMEETGLSKDELLSLNEEAHYVHTINDFVELIVVYGYDKVIGDLRTAMGNKTW